MEADHVTAWSKGARPATRPASGRLQTLLGQPHALEVVPCPKPVGRYSITMRGRWDWAPRHWALEHDELALVRSAGLTVQRISRSLFTRRSLAS